MNAHELNAYCELKIIMSLQWVERQVVLCMYALHARSFNYKSDYINCWSFSWLFSIKVSICVFICMHIESVNFLSCFLLQVAPGIGFKGQYAYAKLRVPSLLVLTESISFSFKTFEPHGILAYSYDGQIFVSIWKSEIFLAHPYLNFFSKTWFQFGFETRKLNSIMNMETLYFKIIIKINTYRW